jgi:CRP/FNR family transcriptional regulator
MNAPPLQVVAGNWPHLGIARCTASDVLAWSGLSSLVSTDTDAVAFNLRRVPAEVPLVHQGQRFDHLFCVAAGSFKCVQTDVEGYEQVIGFAIQGDLVGLEGLALTRYSVGAVALEESSVAVLPFGELVEIGHRVPALEKLLHRAAGVELMHRNEKQYLMSAASAEVRVARFLTHFAQRQQGVGHSGRRLRLCMTRREIASCLGVAHETVSRALSALAHHGIIRVSHRDVEIVDAPALYELQRMTRGTPHLQDGHEAGTELAA